MARTRICCLAAILLAVVMGGVYTVSNAGLPTLTPITIDGDLSDWQTVLQNPVQVTHDGDGSSYGSTCIGSTDRDCEVKGGVGRDLLTFAWTYYDDNLYLYVERWGSSDNIITFFFIMDLDANGMAESTDRVLVVRWWGEDPDGEYDAWLYEYVPDPLGSGSDPMVDGSGYADGYCLPGSLGTELAAYLDVPGGDVVTGTQFEAYVPWADLGLPGPTPINFHVAAHNNTNFNVAEDNLGGPDGGMGSFGFGGVDIEPAWLRATGSPSQVLLPHTITNIGNVDGLFDLEGVSTLGLSLSYYSDPDGDQSPDALLAVDANGDGDFDDAGDTAPAPADDTNGDGRLDFSLLASGDTVHFVLQADIPEYLDQVTDFIDLTVQMDGAPSITDTTRDIISVGYFSVYPDGNKSAIPGGIVRFGHLVTNNQPFQDTADMVVFSIEGWDVTLYSDPNQDGDPSDGVQLARDLGGDGGWDFLDEPGSDTNGDGAPDTGPLAAAGGTTGYVVELAVDPAAVAGTTVDQTTVRAVSELSPNRFGQAIDRTRVLDRITLKPDNQSLIGSAGESVYFPLRAINSWSGPDSFALTAVSAQGWSTVIWSDPDGNGSIDDGAVITNTGPVPGMGGVFHLVVELQIPAGTTGGTSDTVTITATSDDDPAESDSATAQAVVHKLQTFRDSLYNLQAGAFATCETVYIRASGLVEGQVGRYELRLFDPGMNPAGTIALVTTAHGDAETSRVMATADPTGTWTIELWDTSISSQEDAITFEHERDGLVDPVEVTPDPATAGNDLRVASTFTSQNDAAPYSSTVVKVWVRDPVGDVLLDDGSFVPDTGSEVTRTTTLAPLAAGNSTTFTFTVLDVAFPMVGTYTVDVAWEVSCGASIDASAGVTFEVDVDTDGDGIPDSIDICPEHYNPLQDLEIDVDNCGACGNACTNDHGTTSCIDGVCTPVCDAPWDDCDGDPDNGCETDLSSDTSHCGSCANACGDGVGCTDDSCVDSSCVYTANDANCPDDGLYCNGTESCDPVEDCVSSGNPCTGAGLVCDESSDSCVGCLVDADCDDGVGCTDDTCVDTNCVNTANDANCPDDGLYCNGTESCDPVADCVSSGDPCTGAGLMCDEATDSCVECLADGDCDDGVACTDDGCVAGACVFSANDANCPDDGLYCNGTESCDPVADCVSSGDPCTGAGLMCDEDTNSCVECLVDSDCNDGVGCTDDSCLAGSCVNTANNANCPDDGLFCNGSEYCHATSDCTHTGNPCTASSLMCDEASDSCVECLADSDCNDGVGCTDNFCVAGSCAFIPNDINCPDDGVFCNGVELCSPAEDCTSSGNPCTALGLVCDEDNDSCEACLVDADCNDGVFCNGAETCSDGECVEGVNPCPGQICDETNNECMACTTDEDCDDGFWCNGPETCVDETCHLGAEPCPAGLCNEARDVCMDCAQDSDCEDGLFCTGDAICVDGACVPGDDPCPGQGCDEEADVCTGCTQDSDCDDGVFCNGAETCDSGICNAGSWPCPGQACDEEADACVACVEDADCDDGLWCNGSETCDAGGACVAGTAPCGSGLCDELHDACVDCTADSDCDDGAFCNGAERCIGGSCQPGGDPCGGGLCDEDADTCVTCMDDADCDDDLWCNGAETCDAGVCVAGTDPCPGQLCDEASDACTSPACTDDTDCDDGLFCNGAETCVAQVCVPGEDPCPGQMCNEATSSCVDCLADADCDDGVFCNGAETCDAGVCAAGTDPCPGQVCDEANRVCTGCLWDTDCDDGIFCNGTEICVEGLCYLGPDPCPGQVCVETLEACMQCITNADCVDNIFCNGGETCQGGVCAEGVDPCVGFMCDEDTEACVTCMTDADCDDGVGCTDDNCVGGACAFTPNDDLCPDDGLFCNGSEHCDPVAGCISSGDPCSGAGLYCNEDTDSCDSCIDDTDCDDGLFCNGAETCIAGDCVAGTDPCPGQLCDEDNDSCVNCLTDANCDDGLWCNGAETCVDGACTEGTDPCPGQMCDEDTDSCYSCASDADCDDGLFCNGAETCDSGVCVAGEDPCPGQACDEDTDTCFSCTSDADCDDGAFCNGAETCSDGACVAGEDPCPDQICDEDTDSCVDCLTDDDCDDGVFCNGAESCSGGACVAGENPCPDQICVEEDGACVDCLTDDDCDDGLWCNGAESCSDGACAAGEDPCPGQACDEDSDTCYSCTSDADCDDGAFCNGAETCSDGACVEGEDPCPEQGCDEDTDSCFSCLTDSDCDDGVFCNGAETCSEGVCAEGEDPCPGQVCNEANDRCDACATDADCDDQDPCTEDTCQNGACSNVFQDEDGDGICDAEDPCPGDRGNTCQGRVSGGGCGCGAGAAGDGGPVSGSLLVLILLAGLAIVRRGRA